MTGSRTVVKNTGAMLLGTIIRMSASFVLVVFIGRKLGPKGMGEFSLILTLFWVFQTIAGMGIQPLLIREVAKAREKTGVILTNASLLSFIVALVMALAMIGFSHLMQYSHIVQISTLYMAAALIIATVSLVFQAIFIAWEKAELVLIGMTWENIVRLILGILVLLRGGDIVDIAIVFVISGLVNLGVNIWLSCRTVACLQSKIDFHVCLWLARLIPTFAGISIFSTLFWHMDILLLSRMVSIEELGYYSAPMRLINVIKLVLQSYKVAIQPVAARLFVESREEFLAFCRKSLFYVFLISIPISVGGLVLSDQVLPFIFGDAFMQSNLIFRIVIWMIIPYGMVLVLATFLIASHNQKIDLRINIVSMIVAYGLGFALISWLGARGAGIAILASVTVFMLQQLIFISSHLFRLNLWTLIHKIIPAAAVMGLTAWVLREIYLPVNIILCAMVYFAILSFTRTISLKELTQFFPLRRSKL